MASCEKILIAGFTGAGKTSLVRALKSSSPEDWNHFDDLDQIIFKKHGKSFSSLSELIENRGWESFRLWERQELESWLKDEGKGVLALGGGSLSPLVWELFGKSRKIKFCYLRVPFETAWERLIGDASEPRPLIQLGQARLRELFGERSRIFDQIQWQLDGTKNLQLLTREFWESLSK
jgi:shikimate kinase